MQAIAAASLPAALEPVPAAAAVRLRRLGRVGDREAVGVGEAVHARTAGEVVRVLLAAVQHDDQRHRLRGSGCGGRQVELVVTAHAAVGLHLEVIGEAPAAGIGRIGGRRGAIGLGRTKRRGRERRLVDGRVAGGERLAQGGADGAGQVGHSAVETGGCEGLVDGSGDALDAHGILELLHCNMMRPRAGRRTWDRPEQVSEMADTRAIRMLAAIPAGFMADALHETQLLSARGLPLPGLTVPIGP